MASSVDMTKFMAAVGKLSQLSGKDMREVIVAETGKVLETAVRYTPKADREKIKEQVERDVKFRFDNNQSDAGNIYKTKGGKEWFSPGVDGKVWFLIQKWKVPAAVWTQYL